MKPARPKGFAHDIDEHSYQVALGCAYLHGRFDEKIEHFARILGCSAAELAQRMGALLSAAGSGPGNSMSDLRDAATGQGEAMATLALAGGSHGLEARNHRGHRKPRGVTAKGTPMKTPWSHKTSNKQKAYWSKFTEEERSAEVMRRRKVMMANRAKKQREERKLAAAG